LLDPSTLVGPAGPGPDLEPGVDADDDRVALDPGVRSQAAGQNDAALGVELAVGDAREGEALELPYAGLGGGQGGDPLGEAFPVLHRVDEQAAVEAPRDDQPLRQLRAELRGDGDPAFVVDRVLELTEEQAGTPYRCRLAGVGRVGGGGRRRGGRRVFPTPPDLSTVFRHFSPLVPTCR